MIRFALACALFAIAVACSGTSAVRRGDGLAVDRLPENVRADYEVFAQRCSKCHSLARPLESGIDDDQFWEMYVAKMRRMPSSGITKADGEAVLRFLRYYSAEQRKRKRGDG
jgi:hypothetical protein